MERERLGNGRYRVFLSDEELQDWGLSFERLDHRSACTRALLSAILVAVSEGEDLCADSMTAEVFPVEGGCFLLFSGEPQGAQARRARLPLCVGFTEFEELLSFCRAAAALSFLSSRLYSYEKQLWLLLAPKSEAVGPLAALVSEWDCKGKSGDAAAAFLAEHGTLVYAEHAVERLCAMGRHPKKDE